MAQLRCLNCMTIYEGEFCPTCGDDGTVQNQHHQLPQGALLAGRYMVGRVLGQGGFGITYLSWDRTLDTIVAIKEFYPASVVNRDHTRSLQVRCSTRDMEQPFLRSKERFLREANALTRLRDIPQIVEILDTLEENNTAYIVMEYIQGTSLQGYVNYRGGWLPPEETLRILTPVMEAMALVHSRSMVHRDISPDNIMLHPQVGAKLLDFGAVRAVTDPQVDKALTHSTEAILKHGFAPMEQYSSRGSLGPWTDVYAMCATIYYCLTGRVPPSAPERVIGADTMDFSAIPGLPAHQARALEKGIAMNAADRFSSMDQLLSALNDPNWYREPEKPKKWKWIAFVCAAVLVLLAGVLTLALLPGREKADPERLRDTVETQGRETEAATTLPVQSPVSEAPAVEAPTAAPTETTAAAHTAEELYAQAVEEYEHGDLDLAEELFTALGGYSRSDDYLRLIRIRSVQGNEYMGKGYDFGKALTEDQKKDIDAAAQDIAFADTAQVLLSSSEVAMYFLQWNWHGPAGEYLEFKTDSLGGYRYYRSSSISTGFGDNFSVQWGVLCIGTGANQQAVFELEILDRDTISLYSYEKNKTVTMTRTDWSITK